MSECVYISMYEREKNENRGLRNRRNFFRLNFLCDECEKLSRLRSDRRAFVEFTKGTNVEWMESAKIYEPIDVYAQDFQSSVKKDLHVKTRDGGRERTADRKYFLRR